MSNLSLAFLWHMHQPYYRNMITGECVQPWVRLHGIRSYYDMLKLYREYGDIETNINFVPSLLRQLREYVEEGKTDKFLALTQVPAQELDPMQKSFILRNFFMANPDRMIRPYSRYWKLFQQRGENLHKIDFEDTTRYFSWQDYLDIQVYYNLVWFGFKAREEIPEIDQLCTKHHFTEEDKVLVIEIQKKILKNLMDEIRNAPKNVELTTTPFFHPILPLIIDTNIAARCMPKANLPQRFSAPEHAQFQLLHGLTYFEQTVGHRPQGVWPAEGSVCPEMIPLLEKAGVKWIATDEDVLKLSGVSGKKSDFLYQPYTAEHDGSKINIVFRDKELSNLISFSYSKMPTDKAIEDFMGRLASITHDTSHQEAPLITVLLDGENPWETYEANGKPFLSGLFNRLREGHFKTTTINRSITEHPPRHKISHLHSGSWINANYAIWVGKPQKNQGWSYIKRTADELGRKLSTSLGNFNRPENELGAIESFGAACGSDWFWWFDDDFDSEFKSDFDKIFRMHLKNTFTLFKRDIPVFLFDPIFKYQDAGHSSIKPPSFIYPTIDGINTSFFEWANAEKIDVGRHSGTMGQTEELFETIYFGFNTKGFFIRIDPLYKDVTFHLDDEEEIVIYIHNSVANYKLRLFFDGKHYQMQFVSSPEEGYSNGSHKVDWSVRSIFEMGLYFEDLGYKIGEDLTVIITVAKRGIEVRRYSHIIFVVPDETYEKQMWSV